jgi:Glyoxalase-like domain
MTTTFKELSIDTAGDAGVLGRFWAAVTGCEYVENAAEDNPGDVVGSEEGMGIALGQVPEPKTVKHRVHLDVLARSVDDVLALGATLAPDQDPDDPWTVLLDPEGGELCVFLREEVPSYRTHELIVDAADPAAAAAWWAEVFDVPVRNEGQPWSWLTGVPGMPFESLVFQPVPEPKTVKNRIHWDVHGDVDDLLARGATRLWEMPRWTVLADPEGNEFCVFAPRS